MNKVAYPINSLSKIHYTVKELIEQKKETAFIGQVGFNMYYDLYFITNDGIILASNPKEHWSTHWEVIVRYFVDVTISIQEK